MKDTLSLFDEIREMYPLVKDTDATQAYNLMQKANLLRATLDEFAVECDKAAIVAKNNIDVVKSHLSYQFDPKNSTNGNRRAMCCDSYKDVVEAYADAKSKADLYARQIEFLKNVSFQMFAVWDNCRKVGERY